MSTTPYGNMRKDWSMTDSTEQARRAECYPALLEALIELVAISNKNCVGPWLQARAAISKATGVPA